MTERTTMAKIVGVGAWIVCIAVSFGTLQRYAATAGEAHAPADDAEALIARHRQPDRGLIVMVVHPECPCTEASLAELGDLLARSRGRCTALILHYQPAQIPADWSDPPDYLELGGVRVAVVADRAGEQALALGALTSGHAVFADSTGVIRFRGGLTLARGHRGRSPAQDAILAQLAGGAASMSVAPIYGCALLPECNTAKAP